MERTNPLRLPKDQPAGSLKKSTVHAAQRPGRLNLTPSGEQRDDYSRPVPLSPLELEVMDLVWDLQECSSAEVIRAYKEVRQLADTTIRTVLTNIRKKGYLELVPSIERGHRFRPTFTRDQVARHTLQTLVKRLFKGRAREAVELLLADDLMTKRDLAEIRRVVERRQSKLDESR
jgi:BlaI family penicillinase repressor